MVKDKERLYAAAIVVLVGVLAFVTFGNTWTQSSQDAAVARVTAVYSILTEGPVEVVSVKEESGIYRILMRTTLPNGQQTVTEVVATKDGSLFTDRVINTTGYAAQLEREKNFMQCLIDKNVAVVGLANDANTLAQLQALGSFSYKIFVDCSGQNIALCQQANITTVPTIVSPDGRAEGAQPLQFFTQNFQCTL